MINMKTEIFVGTSGWLYSWNPNGFKWYARKARLNAVELNASFYRFPFPSQVKAWSNTSPLNLRWSIKVNRWITHVFKFSEKALNTWKKFEKLFKPLQDKIDFYLFQLPPSIRPRNTFIKRIEKFIENTDLEEKFALEWRNNEWISRKWISWCENLGITLVSIDSPEIRLYVKTGEAIYLRMHGRTAWYAHNYSKGELIEIAKTTLDLNPKKIYIFFNNNHDMLNNARLMLSIFNELLGT